MRHMTTYLFLDAVARLGSIRKAADVMAITPSALNRRVLSIEEEFGLPLFERTSSGLKLNTAGEVVIHHVRLQMADLDRVKSQLADLSGLRRGRVTFAASQSVLLGLLPDQIAKYHTAHPEVAFTVRQSESEQSLNLLKNYETDLALVYRPVSLADFQVLASIPQQIHAIMRTSHPLAQKSKVDLLDCLDFGLALPSQGAGLHDLLNQEAQRLDATLRPVLSCDSYAMLVPTAAKSDLITFRLGIAVTPASLGNDMISRPIERIDAGSIKFIQLKGRTLSVAASRFAEQLVSDIEKQ